MMFDKKHDDRQEIIETACSLGFLLRSIGNRALLKGFILFFKTKYFYKKE